jgi:nicotinamidase-related amidase
MARALLIIDIQNDYFPGGAYPLVGPDAAASAASSVLAGFRSRGEPVIHMQHVWDAPDAAFFKPGTEGVEIHSAVAPADGELVLQKDAPNSFLRTPLQSELESRGIDELVVCGMMTSMCVDASVRAASDLGYDVTLVHDACAAPNLEFGGTSVPGASVHAAFLAAMNGNYATLTSAQEIAS